jgi:hypothetical protein
MMLYQKVPFVVCFQTWLAIFLRKEVAMSLEDKFIMVSSFFKNAKNLSISCHLSSIFFRSCNIRVYCSERKETMLTFGSEPWYHHRSGVDQDLATPAIR